jgi:hypothetical protein
MKLKTLIFAVLAGIFLCGTNISYAQYYHSDGSVNGAFDEGNNVFDLGVGFGGGSAALNSLFTTTGYGNLSYSNNVLPGIRLNWEYGKNKHVGYGIILEYQGATFSDNYIYTNENYTDKYTVSLITIGAQIAYHFTVNPYFDPYIGVTIGYIIASFDFSSTNPNPANEGAISLTGIVLGAHAGARYYFSNHIGIFAEVDYATNYAMNYGNAGLVLYFK